LVEINILLFGHIYCIIILHSYIHSIIIPTTCLNSLIHAEYAEKKISMNPFQINS